MLSLSKESADEQVSGLFIAVCGGVRDKGIQFIRGKGGTGSNFSVFRCYVVTFVKHQFFTLPKGILKRL